MLTGKSRAASKHFIASGMKKRTSCFHIYDPQKNLFFWNRTEVACPKSPEIHSTHNQPWMFYIQVRKRKHQIWRWEPFYMTHVMNNVLSKGKERRCRCFYFGRGNTLNMLYGKPKHQFAQLINQNKRWTNAVQPSFLLYFDTCNPLRK